LGPDSNHLPREYRIAAEVISLIGDKWTVLVIVRIADGRTRFSQLQRDIGGISQKMLASTLKALERDGFVSRTVFPIIPPRVEYELTDLGRMLLGPLRSLGQFAISNSTQIEAARLRFDRQSSQDPPARLISRH
jgi:DNA-binding HxlR family transcriptional regulator